MSDKKEIDKEDFSFISDGKYTGSLKIDKNDIDKARNITDIWKCGYKTGHYNILSICDVKEMMEEVYKSISAYETAYTKLEKENEWLRQANKDIWDKMEKEIDNNFNNRIFTAEKSVFANFLLKEVKQIISKIKSELDKRR